MNILFQIMERKVFGLIKFSSKCSMTDACMYSLNVCCFTCWFIECVFEPDTNDFKSEFVTFTISETQPAL